MQTFLTAFTSVFMALVEKGAIVTSVLRFVFPLLAIAILARCALSLLGFQELPEVWGHIAFEDGSRIAITHWENTIGRTRANDIQLNFPEIYKQHAVLTRYDDGSWTISEVAGRGGIAVDGEVVEDAAEVGYGQLISLNGIDVTLVPISAAEAKEVAAQRTAPQRLVSPALTLILLTLFQGLTAVQLMISCDETVWHSIAVAIGVTCAVMWGLFIFEKLMRSNGYEVETIAFFLCTMGEAVVASVVPDELIKTMATMIIGIVMFLVIGMSMRNLERAKKLRYIAAAMGPVMLAAVLVLGTSYYGAKCWIEIGSFSFQPSELVKISFVLAGASTLERLMTRRNLFLFILYSGIICILLALCNDFGSAMVFFVAFLTIAFLRSGDFATLSLICAGTGFAGMMAVKLRPHVLNRFANWRHIWEAPADGGYQQTQALMCAAAGGIFGLGAGNGKLKYIFAADSDLVFATVCEEWGLLMAICCVVCILMIALYAVRAASMCRSSFYVIAACASMTILVFQMILNVFGTVDFLPFTGVTFPFLSNGGSSMIGAWGLLAFVKAADTRKNSSFAAKQPKIARKPANEESRWAS